MRLKIKNFLIKVKSFENWKKAMIGFVKAWPKMFRYSYVFSTFFLLLVFFAFGKIFGFLKKIPLIKIGANQIEKLWKIGPDKFYQKIFNKFEKVGNSEVKRSYLISVAYKNLMAKKARSIVTIFGMSAGVGVIVLLLSLGYGIEKLVISQVASLEELKIVDVSTSSSTALKLNKDLFSKIKKMAKVEDVVPLTSFVGRISFNKAKTDVLVYAASNKYLELLKTKLKKGKFFDNNDQLSGLEQEVAGVSTEIIYAEYKKEVDSNKTIYFNIHPEDPIIAWEDCTTDSKILGFVPRIEGGFIGKEYWGSRYFVSGEEVKEGYDEKRSMYLAKWIKGNVPIFTKTEDDSLRPVIDENGGQKWENACIQEIDLYITKEPEIKRREVLGEATESAELTSLDSWANEEATAEASFDSAFDSVVVGTDSAGLSLVELAASGSAFKTTSEIKFNSPPSGKAILSLGMLALLNIPEDSAVGTKFKVQFILSKSLSSKLLSKATTDEVEYQVMGIIDDDTAQYFYIPINDINKLEIDNFSQMKIVLSDVSKMGEIRKNIENLGFKTNSTADTVSQIEGIFANIRLVLGLLGMVALIVASLGMFNTLTVSLLERTREIGGMKTMGMISEEVKDLFLAEAMIMGLSGGVGGLALGYLAGKLLSILVSFVALSKGEGIINLTYVPFYLIIFILVMSFFVGMVTGLYPAKRAKKISALNALRYE